MQVYTIPESGTTILDASSLLKFLLKSRQTNYILKIEINRNPDQHGRNVYAIVTKSGRGL